MPQSSTSFLALYYNVACRLFHNWFDHSGDITYYFVEGYNELERIFPPQRWKQINNCIQWIWPKIICRYIWLYYTQLQELKTFLSGNDKPISPNSKSKSRSMSKNTLASLTEDLCKLMLRSRKRKLKIPWQIILKTFFKLNVSLTAEYSPRASSTAYRCDGLATYQPSDQDTMIQMGQRN